MDRTPDAKEQQQKPSNEVSADKNPNGVASTDELSPANLYRQLECLTAAVRVLQQKSGLQTCGELTPASSFPLSLDGDPAKELPISSPPSEDGNIKESSSTASSSGCRCAFLDRRLKSLKVKEQYDNAIRLYMTVEDTDDEESFKDKPFIIRTRIDTEGSETTYLDIKSRKLQAELKEVFGNIPNINLDVTNASVMVKVLYHWIYKLRNHIANIERTQNEETDQEEEGEEEGDCKDEDRDDKDGDEEDKESQKDEDTEHKEVNSGKLSPDLELLIHWAKRYEDSVVEELDAVVNKGKIRFDLLWAFFEPGTKLYLQCPHTDAPMCVTFQSGEQTTDNHNETCFSVTSHYVSRSKDGKPGYTLKKILVPYFWGEKDIKDLNIYPLSYHANEEELRRELIERGRKYARLMKDPYSHKMFTGRTFFINAQNEAVVRFADSRIMVDSDSFVKYPPGRHRVPNVMCFQHDMTWDNLDDKNLLICSATAYAYILHLRHFAEVPVDHIRDIEWNESTSFEHDVMLGEKEKTAITAVAEQALGESQSGKEYTGHFVVFYGGPGVGKTLTANVLAEQHKAPMFLFSPAQHENNAESLELFVDIIFQLCSRWKAVLLMDEGDVYLSKRFAGHSAVVAVFLRHIELYRGLLIVTTNRYNAMDDAVIDRVSLPVEYPSLTNTQREELWEKTLAKQRQGELLCKSQIKQMADNGWNGRRIWNCLKLAVAFAGKAPLTFDNLKDAAELQKQRLAASEREREEASRLGPTTLQIHVDHK
ncbi:hypothetical protein F5883DRAFT_577668 [Diaporthe sp. PMI_573]|nr:hypothetical protein F5883DRAFT_577668 [Diaporthaceae sp. PMI_573]